MTLEKLRLLWHAVKHTRPIQLWHRLRLTAKRKLLVRWMTPARANAVAWHDPSGVPLSPNPVQPIMPDRLHHVVGYGDADVTVRFLNIERAFALPFAWRPDELHRKKLLWLLTLHYHEFLEALPGPLARDVVLDWIEQVKPYVPNYWLDTWNSYTLSLRIVVWMQLLASDRLPLDEAQRTRVHGSLLAQLRFLESNLEVDLGGNHLLKNVKALLWGSRYFDGPEADRWRALGESLLKQELDEQVLADGMHYELSPTYHNQVMVDFLESYTALHEGELKTELAARLADMAQVTAEFHHPDGGVSLFNDAGLYFAYQPEDVLNAWRAVFAEEIEPSALIALPSSGYYGLRHARDLLLVDCAALAPDFLPAHGHGDALSFEWSIAGQRVFTDPGVFEYQDGPMRAYSRSTPAHSTVSIAEEDQSEFWKSFRVGRRARITACRHTVTDHGFTLQGAHDGYTRLSGAPVHERTFEATPDTLTLHDTVHGGADQPCTATLFLHPDCDVHLEDATHATVCTGGTQVRVESEGPMTVEPATYHPDHGHSHDTFRLRIELGTASGTLQHSTRITVLERD
ncbi:MAG: alginate lyase family protein [Pseudomonadota bacterium]